MASSVTPSRSAAHNEAAATAATDLHVTPPRSASTRGPSGNNPGPSSKRRRINFACDYCRSRKTRCDEGQPSCYACSAAGIQCITRNRRQPWLDVQRHEAGKGSPRTRMNDMVRQAHTDSDATSGVAVASSTISTHEDEISASHPRRSQQQHQANETMTVQASTSLSIDHVPSQVENDDVVITDPSCHNTNHHARHGSIQRTSAHRPDTRQIDDDRPEHRPQLPIIQDDSGNTPLEFMTRWLDLARYRLHIPRSNCRQTAQSNQEPTNGTINNQGSILPGFIETPDLPDQEVLSALVNWFLEGPNVVFPLVEPKKIMHAAQMAFANGPKSFARQYGLASLMQVYLVMTLGYASRPNSDLDFDAERCLQYSQSLLGLILQQNTIETLRAVMLLSMALRCHDNLASAGHTMSLAVSLAVSLGLPKQSSRVSPGEEKRNVWTSVFSFEKFLSFELGRSSLIIDDYPDLLPNLRLPSDREPETENLGSTSLSRQQPKQPISEVVLSLASLLSDVGRLCVQVSRKENDGSYGTTAEIIREKVQTTGLSCLKLMDWASDICPSYYSPITDILFDSKTHAFASFIAMQYHAAMVILMRNSLLISEKEIRRSVDVIAKGEPWEFAMRNGQNLAANSARKILRLFLESLENEVYPVLSSLAGPLHAMGVLAVFVLTRQNSIMANMDRELLRAATLAIKDKNTLDRVEKELQRLNVFEKTSTRSRIQNVRMPSQRSGAEGSMQLQAHTTGDQAPVLTRGFPMWTPDHNASLVQSGEESFIGIPTRQMSELDGHDEVACSDWIEDSSPMIMDEFGWNWANFLQLVDARDAGTQIQL